MYVGSAYIVTYTFAREFYDTVTEVYVQFCFQSHGRS